METIIYFYKKRGLQEPVVEPVGLKAYMLVRVAMDVGREEWFGRKLDEGEPAAEAGKHQGESQEENPEEARGRFWKFLRHPFPAIRQWRVQKKRRGEELLCRTELAMGKLAAEILELADGSGDCFCVYDDGTRKGLVGVEAEAVPHGDWQREYLDGGNGDNNQERTLASLWKDCFPIPEFKGYGRLFWVERLLPQASLPHFVILGTSPDIHEVIERLAPRMKSLRWVLLEKDCNQERWDFVEDFYTEYGLAITLQVLESGTMFRRLRFACETSVNVLDFTLETQAPVSEMAAGSVWLDMMSVEGKRRRVQGRGIAYFSLKEEWRRAQKRCNCPLV